MLHTTHSTSQATSSREHMGTSEADFRRCLYADVTERESQDIWRGNSKVVVVVGGGVALLFLLTISPSFDTLQLYSMCSYNSKRILHA